MPSVVLTYVLVFLYCMLTSHHSVDHIKIQRFYFFPFFRDMDAKITLRHTRNQGKKNLLLLPHLPMYSGPDQTAHGAIQGNSFLSDTTEPEYHKILNVRTDISEQTVQTQIRLL